MNCDLMNAIKRLVVCCLFATVVFQASAQDGQHERPNVPIGTNCNGYLEYLPTGYSAGSARYPLLINILGFGTEGNGSLSSLQALYNIGAGNPHEQAHQGTWPDSYTVNSNTYQFVVITPQFIQSMLSHTPTPAEVDAVVTYVVQNYRIDTSRIYMIGSSQGGGAVWDYVGGGAQYAKRIAAIEPFAGVSWPIEDKANIIKHSKVAVWAFHNQFDESVPSYFTSNYVDFINQIPAPAVPVKKTLFNAAGHQCWFLPLTRQYTENGLNVYQWLLQFSKTFTKANAGTYQEITAPASSVQLHATGTGPNGTISSYNWQKISGPASSSIANAALQNPTVTNLVPGIYVFRLTITDNAFGTATEDVVVRVNRARTRIEAEAATFKTPGIVENPTADGGNKLDGITSGKWMDYTINVPISGMYKFRFRIGSFYSANQLSIKDASGNTLGSATAEVFNTGDWDAFLTMTILNVPLQAGIQTIRIQGTNTSFTSNVWYMNWFEFENTTTPLPVHFLLFNANCNNGRVDLSWKTAAEMNADKFIIERSSDGRTWAAVGTVAATGQSSSERTYGYTDATASDQNSFYRIAQQDIDGRKTYTAVLRANCSGKQNFSVFPNPATDKTTLSLSADQNSQLNLSVVDAKGRIVKTQQLVLPKGNSMVNLDLADLPTGMYMIQARWNGQTQTAKLLKK